MIIFKVIISILLAVVVLEVTARIFFPTKKTRKEVNDMYNSTSPLIKFMVFSASAAAIGALSVVIYMIG